MKVRFFIAILALFLGLLPMTAQTGSQEGSVAIAAAIRPATAVAELDEFAECVAKNKGNGASYKEAAKDCKEYRKILAKESTRIANEAADATKASRPMILGYGRDYGYGYGYGNYGYRNYGRRTIIVRHAAPPRPPVPPRPAAPPRPVPNR